MDPEILTAPARLSNGELLARVERLACDERGATAVLVVHLAVLDERRLYLGEGYSSLFSYCTQVLRFSEHAAYGRIEAARTGRRFPVLFEMLGQGAINLTAVCMLAAHLTQDNHGELLAAASHKSKRQVEDLIARLRPKPAVPATVRKLPDPPPSAIPTRLAGAPANGQEDVVARVEGSETVGHVPPQWPRSPAATTRPAVVEPLAPERYRVQFTAGPETCDKLRLAQDLLRHQIPDGDPAKIFDRALTALLENLARHKFATTDRPRESRGGATGSRHIPSHVKRAVWLRDGGRCGFVARNGRRCDARGFLEFHHVTPHAAGGEPTAANIQLRCRAHNHYEAELYFGPREPLAAREARVSYSATRSGPSCSGSPRGPQAPG